MIRKTTARLDRPALVLAVAGLLALAAGAAAAEKAGEASWEQMWEHWYVLELAGAPAGWSREIVSSDGRRYRTETKMKMKVGRGAIPVEINLLSAWVETHDGEPVEMHYVQDMALQSVETRWRFAADHVESITRHGDREIKRKLELPEPGWLPPLAAHEYWKQRRQAGATTVTTRTLSGESGLKPVEITYELTGEEQMEFKGRKMPVTVWKTTNDQMPEVALTSKFSSDGHLVYQQVSMGVATLVMKIATKEQALGVEREPAPELMLQTFIEVEKPIARPREARAATYRLRVKDGAFPELPSAGAQRFAPARPENTAIVRLDMTDNLPATEAERADAAYLDASALVDTDDVLIAALVKRACKDAGEVPMRRADAMRAFVHKHISAKDLDTAFATASETARMRTGDCSEHGVLLCAMLRSDGIPARAASGLVYADSFAGESDIFGWHMWTQGLIDGKWVDFDATLDRRFDAAHVLIGTSSLAEGTLSTDLASAINLLGNLEIDVLEVVYPQETDAVLR